MKHVRFEPFLAAVLLAAATVAWMPSPAVGGYVNHGDPDEFTFFATPTAWNPGPNTARFGGFPAPGGATWSIMVPGISNPLEPVHTGVSTSMDLMGGAGTADEEAIINAALNRWASVSGFVNLGKVADGGVVPGAAETVGAGGGDDGDIRIGSYNFPAPAMGSVTLAHAFQPGVQGFFGGTPPDGGTILGDLHINNFANGPLGVTWVDDPTGINAANTVDLFTVVLHELGHALGLGHSIVPGSVMEATYAGTRRSLSVDDILGIQAIYGVAVPEPSSLLFFVIVTGMLAAPLVKRVGKGFGLLSKT